ncbi:hypothetical protein DERF_006290 [Dermatophagoides farinae]|uniref:Uncharacterized protein n=1 Tax=Dermatophagoides farinae TaxID=6954 RepID=A0A922I566_DERFA|nr:hypothetical protein DERF_006290 [Dermatophagoides farinae]
MYLSILEIKAHDEIVENIRRLIRGKELLPMKPWFKGFTGTIEQIDDKQLDLLYLAKQQYWMMNRSQSQNYLLVFRLKDIKKRY